MTHLPASSDHPPIILHAVAVALASLALPAEARSLAKRQPPPQTRPSPSS